MRVSAVCRLVEAKHGPREPRFFPYLAERGFRGSGRLQHRETRLPLPGAARNQVRPDVPREDGDGKAIKYETPAGSPVRLDVHPSQTGRVKDASVPLWITEGVKKADSLVSRGGCAVALQGVWCWQKDGLPLRDWEDVRLWGRSACAIFDSDVTTNPKVQAALEGLVGFLRGRGARVAVAYLPDAADGGKQGVDDFLASGKEVRDLEPFVHQGLREDLLPAGKPLSEVEPERVEWLWPRRIPKGKITVLDGDPDNGKSVLTTDLAARVTAGLALPDGTPTEAAGAVIVSAEDGASDTIRPRFDAAGGDPHRALLLGDEEPFAIPGDIPKLERAVRRVGAALVVVDPIMAFLSGDVNSNRDQDVRRALTPLKRMAERTGAAVVLVRHLNKTQGGNPLYRGGGSIGIIGAARSGMVVGPHPDSDELRVLAGQKNLSLPPRSLAYGIETAENGAARIAYRGFSEATAGQILRVPDDEEEKSALAEAEEFLNSELRPHLVAAKAIKKSAREAEISERTLRRAKQVLGVKSQKESDGSWTWSLPDKGSEGGHTPTVGNVGSLGKDANPEREDSAYLGEEVQGGQEVHGDHERRCKHGLRGGVGCYLCDPRHPYRLKQGGAA